MERVRALVAALDSAGDLPAGFGRVLEAVPREHFIPDHVWVDREPIDRATEPDRWLKAVYRDEAIVTQFDDGRTEWPDAGDRPTCSASMPSVVAGMVDALRVSPGHSVLEAGTGTGYNAALLSEIVGATGTVTTIEIDPTLAAAARDRLNAAGYQHVNTMVGDATHGAGSHPLYDRIIATMAVPLGRVPYAWVEQTRPGGVIVTPIRADLASGPLVRFTVGEDGTATGRTLPMGVAFMESRAQRTARTPDDDIDWEQDGTSQSVTTVTPWPLLDTPSSRWALAVLPV
jgi:protein-L-isoaspartate(D-aspartate) O-methyltransferase